MGNTSITQSYALPYKVYVANITQSGINAPVATVEQNTLSGTPVWSYVGAGDYLLTLAGEFPTTSKVVIFNSRPGGLTIGPGNIHTAAVMLGEVSTANSISFITFYNGVAPADTCISIASIEIRVYP